MRFLPTFLVALVLIVSASCNSAVLKSPLVDPEKATRFPVLDGTFKSVEPSTKKTSWLHVGSAGREFPAGFHKIVWVSEFGDFGLISVQLCGFLEKIEDHYFLHLPCPEISEELEEPRSFQLFPGGWDPESVRHYSLFRLSRSNEGIDIQFLNASYVISQIESNSLKGTVRIVDPEDDMPSKFAMITAKPAELLEYLKSDSSEKLFERKIHFKRID